MADSNDQSRLGGTLRGSVIQRALLGVVLGPIGAAPAMGAATGSPDPEATELSPIVVVATKMPRPLADVVGTVSVIEAGAIADQLAGGIGDLVRYQPGISAPRETSRFGRSGYTIRGIGGNRVAIEIDGVPVADRFEIGSFSNAGRDLVDVNVLKRVEVLRGPASTLYGSDAIGGVVSYHTFEAEDLVPEFGRPHLGLSAGHLGADDSMFASARVAWAQPDHGLLAALSYRDGHQLDAAAASGEDRQDYQSLSAFAKASWNRSPTSRLTATVDHFERDAATEIRSVLGSGRFASTTRLDGDDRQQRDRLSVAYEFGSGPAWAADGRIVVYGQRADTDQVTLEERAASGIRRAREFGFTQDVLGLELDLSSEFELGGVSHRLGYGLELARTDTEELRDALQTDLAGNNPTRVILGEHFPVRDFPNSRTLEAGFYLHDEIVFEDSRWTWVPALRFDYYDLDPRPDEVYRGDNPATEVVQVREHNVSPKLGFTYDISAGLSAFGQYAYGFRAPPFEDANIGLDIPLFNIRAIPNPDLKSESSQGLELGLRYFAPATSVALAAHYTEYDDFIETKARLGTDPDTGVILFQSRNIDRARIYGAELRLEQRLGAWTDALDSFEVSLALAWTRGENRRDGAELIGVDPAEAVAALRWQPPSWPLAATLTATFVDRKRGLDAPADDQFHPAGYGIVDLTASYRPRAGLALRAGLFNLGNKIYWHWADVQGLGAGDPLLPVLANPGRHAALSVSLDWQ